MRSANNIRFTFIWSNSTVLELNKGIEQSGLIHLFNFFTLHKYGDDVATLGQVQQLLKNIV